MGNDSKHTLQTITEKENFDNSACRLAWCVFNWVNRQFENVELFHNGILRYIGLADLLEVSPTE